MAVETKSCDRLYAENVISNDAFVETPNHTVSFRATNMIIIIDGPIDPDNYLEWSWDGRLVHGKIKCEDHHIAFDWSDGYKNIWLRGRTGVSINYRLFLWVRQR